MSDHPATCPRRTEPNGHPGHKRRGRRPGGENTRELILASARELFISEGYDGVSMRAVARRADVDPAMVHHYFDRKAQLFVASMSSRPGAPGRPMDRLAETDARSAGRETVEVFMSVWDPPDGRAALVSLLHQSGSIDEGQRPVREFTVAEVMRQLPISTTDPDEALRRAGLVVGDVLGMAMCRYVLNLPPWADADHDEVVDLLAPVVQRHLDGE